MSPSKKNEIPSNAGPKRTEMRSGMYRLALDDEFAGLDRLDREDLDDADGDSTTPLSRPHPLAVRANKPSRKSA